MDKAERETIRNMAKMFDLGWLHALLDQIDALEQKISDHNDDCMSSCNSQMLAGAPCHYYGNIKRKCPTCPQDWIIAAAPEPQGNNAGE